MVENKTSSHGKSNEGVDFILTVDLPDIPTGTKAIKHVRAFTFFPVYAISVDLHLIHFILY